MDILRSNFTLETLGLIVAVLDNILGIFGVFINAGMGSLAEFLKVVLKNSHIQVFPYSAQYSQKSEDEKMKEEVVKTGNIGFAILSDISVIFGALSCLQVFMSTLLIIFIFKKSDFLMTVWMVFKVISMGIVLFVFWNFYLLLSDMIMFCVMLVLGDLFCITIIHYLKNQFQNKEEALPLTT